MYPGDILELMRIAEQIVDAEKLATGEEVVSARIASRLALVEAVAGILERRNELPRSLTGAIEQLTMLASKPTV